jgi:DNA polymerase-4
MAKLVTEYAKPYGVKVLFKNEEEAFIHNINIEKFAGIGKQFAQRLHGYGISTLGQVKNKKELFYSWKKPGIQLYNRICGLDKEKVASFYDKKYDSRKSIGIGRTFDALASRDELKRRVIILCRYISFLVKKQKVNPQTFFMKIKYEYHVKSKNSINTNRLFSETYFKQTMMELFIQTDKHPTHKVIQLNIAVSNFNEYNPKSYDIFNYEEDLKRNKLHNTLQQLREKFGVDIIKSGIEL